MRIRRTQCALTGEDVTPMWVTGFARLACATVGYMTKRTQQLRAAELAWVLTELCRVGHRLSQAGWCLGQIRGDQIGWQQGTLMRMPDRHLLVRARSGFARWRHARAGHDDSCFQFGVPRSAVRRILEYWGREQTAQLVCDVFDEVMVESHLYEAAGVTTIDLLTHLVGRRITVCVPADQER